jgi:DNA-binding transcriptional regulator YhcF (GntR family)
MKDRQPRVVDILTYAEVPRNKRGEALEPNTLIIEEETLRRGFTTAPNYILDDTRVSIAARFTYIILLSFAWQQGSCFPGQTRLAQKLGVSRQMANRYLAELKVKGFIDWQRRGLGKTNVYRILKLPKSEADVKPSLHQDVKPASHQHVKPVLHKEYSGEENAGRKDSDHSKFRKADSVQGKEEQRHPIEIAGTIENLSKGELHDPMHAKSNVTRAMNMWRQSNLPKEEITALIREARKITLARSGSIKKRAENYMGLKNRAPYFFQVLQDLIHKHALARFRTALAIRKSIL